jgi:hypothetical protein
MLLGVAPLSYIRKTENRRGNSNELDPASGNYVF